MKRFALLLIAFCFEITASFAQLTGDQSDYEPFADSTVQAKTMRNVVTGVFDAEVLEGKPGR